MVSIPMDMTEWIEFYSKYIACPDLKAVIARCLELEPEMPEFKARRMMLQCKRLVDISEAQENATENSHALKLFFLVVLAENSAKFYYNYEGDGSSKKYVRKYFEEMMPEEYRDYLQGNLFEPGKPLNLRFSVDFLYAVRCDVAHEGMYYMFHFRDGDCSLLVDAGGTMASIDLRYEDLVKIVVITAYVSIKNRLGI